MKLLTLATLLTSVICNDNHIYTVGGPWDIDTPPYRCVQRYGMSTGVDTQYGDTITLYKGDNCNGPYAWGTGRYNFRRPYTFNSYRVTSDDGPILYGKSANGASQTSEGANKGGEPDDASFYNAPHYYRGSGFGVDY